MSQPNDPREAELVRVAASVIAHLVLAHERADHPAIAEQVGRLLNSIAKYNAAMAERAGDAPLRRAVAMLNR